ncbi:MAG: Gldg family protein [Kiritimatiellia bacterium]|jgi:ABC-type uncharacterized transport system involved in gliding motility auxiliary subunit
MSDLNTSTPAKTRRRLGAGVAGLAVLLVIIGAIVVIAGNLRLRLDLTEHKLFTLSRGSRQLLGRLENDVTLKLFFSESARDMPMGLKTYAHQVRDLLREYEIAGKGRIHLEQYDPKPDSDAEEWAHRYAIEPQQVNPFGEAVYFGLVAVCGDAEATLPGFSPRFEQTLEYDITRLVARVAWPEKPVVGVLSPLPVLGAPQNPMMMMQRRQQQDRGWAAFVDLRANYTLREIDPDAESIDPDIKTLVVVHPKNLSEKTLLALDQFVLRGGRLVALVDPFNLIDLRTTMEQNPMAMQMGGGPGASTLGPLFDAWGVDFDTSMVVADLASATKLNDGRGGVEENPVFLTLDPKNLSRDDLVTSPLSLVMLPFAGALEARPVDGVAFTPLITTSEADACLVDAASLQMGIDGIKRQLAPDGVQRVLAARLQGTFKTAFPNGIADDGTNAVPARLQSGDGTVVVFADADFLHDSFCVQMVNTFFGPIPQPINENLSLFSGTVEQLAGREELIGLRSRGQFNRPFTKVDELEVKAVKQWQAEEERLEAALRETETRLAELQRQREGSDRLILSKEQQEELARFRKTQTQTRRQLKEVRKNLYRDIESLGLRLKVLNIVIVPLAVACFGIARGVLRKRR